MPAAWRRKLIEVDLPLDAISAESVRERSINHGHPSTLHQWWARRPLAACRAVIFASLVDDPADCPEEFPDTEAQAAERERLHALIRRLVVWENSSDANLLAEARYEIARSVARAQGEPPPPQGEPAAVLDYLNRQAQPIYDPFCGGGSIPLEAQRLGLRAVGSDLNPVATLITKALIELPPRFANRTPVNPDADPMGMTVGKGKPARQLPWRGSAGLADDVRYYGRQLRELAWKRLGHLYPPAKLPDGGEATVIAWLWARTVPCPNPACGVAMPLLTTFQVSKKPGNEHWLWPEVDRAARAVTFTVRNRQPPKEILGVDRTVTRNGATCLACQGAVKLEYVRQQARAGNMGEVMTCIVAEGDRKRLFLSPTDEHRQASKSANPNPRSIPQQKMPTTAYLVSGRGYGITHWHQLFTQRQLTALTTFSELLSAVKTEMQADGADADYIGAVSTYLALGIGRMSNSCSSYARWQNAGDKVAGVFARQAIPMIWDSAESNPFCSATQNWTAQTEWIAEVLEALPRDTNEGISCQADAATTIHADSGPVIVTDPPYYDNIGYADLSDYFYVWLRPLLRDIYPDLFAGITTPKDEEMVAVPRFGDPRQRFEDLLNQTLRLIKEHCSPEFPSSIFYAYKQQEQERDGVASTGWETMLTALVNTGFQIVGTWPIHTEMPGRARHIKSNALASSVILVCRPRPEGAAPATRGDFMAALERELPPALTQLTLEGHIAPVDLRQAAIGPGMAVYSRYASVATLAGEPVTVRQALAAINDGVARFLEDQVGAMDAESRFCLDWLQQTGGQGDYGLAEDLARASNLSVAGRLEREHRLLTTGQGRVTLLGVDAYGKERGEPGAGMTAWEAVHRMAWHMLPGEEGGGVRGCAAVARQVGDRRDDVERLARFLYDIYDQRSDSRRAVAFNSVVTALPDIVQQAAAARQDSLV